MRAINLSLISHTNVGKTTLARTLLRRDVGEVVDAPHVTELASDYTLIETGHGDVLRLWDTPGFGDSARLLRRLRQGGNALGWFLAQVWDRFSDRPFFSSQQALRNIRDEAHLVLYLVNSAEDPSSAGYLDPEMQIVGWLGKPVIVLLNQLGAPRPAEQESREVERWAGFLARYPWVRDTIAFDAFARCWVQEHSLLERIGAALPESDRDAYARIDAAWRARNEAVFRQSLDALARELAAIAVDGEQVATAGVSATATAWLRSIAGGERRDARLDAAMNALAERADARIRRATDELIALHGLSGSAAAEVQARMAADFAVDAAAKPGKAGVMGAVVSGALGGLAADLATGGLSLGAGTLLGAILGAAGGVGFAHGYNLLRGTDVSTVRWDGDVLTRLVTAAALRYLAVAHFGRGRGDFVASEYPAHWRPVVAAAVAGEVGVLGGIWALAEGGSAAPTVSQHLEPSLERVLRRSLAALYPLRPA
jgi:hypothetical protein